MKRICLSLIIIFGLLIMSSCAEDNETFTYESGIYRPYKQDISPIYAFADNKEIDGRAIKVTASSGKKGDFIIVGMDPAVDALREETIRFNSIYLGKDKTAKVYCPSCLDEPLQVSIKKDSLFMTPRNLIEALKFSPHSELGVVLVKGDEAERYATIRGTINHNGLIISTYIIYVKSPGIIRGPVDTNWLDLDYLKSELRNNDTLLYVKKETYFKRE